MEKNPKDKSYSKNVPRDEHGKSDATLITSTHQNLPATGEHVSASRSLSSSRLSKTLSESSEDTSETPFKNPENLNEPEETSSSGNTIISSRIQRVFTQFSSTVDTDVSPTQNVASSSPSVLLDSDASGSIVNPRSRPSLGDKYIAQLKLPERVSSRVISSRSKSLKESSISPDNETVFKSTTSKTLRSSPEIDSFKSKTIKESCKLRSSLSTGVKDPLQSPELRSRTRSADTLISPRQNLTSSPVSPNKASKSRSHAGWSKDFRPETYVAQPQFKMVLPRSASDTILTSSRKLAFSIENLSKEPSTVISNLEAQQNPSDPLLQRDTSSTADYFSTSKNRPVVGRSNIPSQLDVNIGEASTSSRQSLASDGSSIVLDDERIQREIESISLSRIDWLPDYASEAHLLLQSVLKELMLSNEDSRRSFYKMFRPISESFSSEVRRCLRNDLRNYHQSLVFEYMSRGLRNSLETHNWLLEIVIYTLILTLSENLRLGFHNFLDIYQAFRQCYSYCSQYWENINLEVIEDEAERARKKNCKKKALKLSLATLTAIRLLLMYFGEKVPERIVKINGDKISQEDKIYFRRT